MNIERPKQEITAKILGEILGSIRGFFYAKAEPKKWFQDLPFLRQNVVLWAAHWLDRKGVTLPPERFRDILTGIFKDIAVHRQAETVQYWPGFLAHCVQVHFEHHGEAYYEEGKSFRAILERTAMAYSHPQAAAPDSLARMAESYRLLKRSSRPARHQTQKGPSNQLDLL